MPQFAANKGRGLKWRYDTVVLKAVDVTPNAREDYRQAVLPGMIESVRRAAAALSRARELLVNATAYGGGVAEIQGIGAAGRELVPEHFLLTRYLHDYVRMFRTLTGLRPTERD